MFTGKNVVVTAAAGNVGRNLVEKFYSSGAVVIAADINENGLNDLANTFSGIRILVQDVATVAGAEQIIKIADNKIDVLCNNAALIEATVMEDIEEKVWDEVLRVNLTGPFLLSRRVIPLMVKSGGGVIINTGSTASLRGGRCGPAYTASKHGLMGLTQNIAAAYFDKGIRCNIVCPGHIERPEGAPEISLLQSSQKMVSRPWDRSVSAGGIASLIYFLASDDANHINGVAIPIDEAALAF